MAAVSKTIVADKGFFIRTSAILPLFVKATGRLPGNLLYGGQWAKPLRFDRENRIKLAAKVLQSNDRSKLYEFFLAKMSFESVEETICDPLVRIRHPFAKL